jgi:hypothetical protein
MNSTRMVTESPVYQGSDEQIAYVFEMGTIGTPTGPYASLLDIQTGGTMGTANFAGSATINGTQITTSIVKNIAPFQHWRLTAGGTILGNKISVYVEIIGE